MAAPVASYVQLPTDTANTGKKNRTQTKVAGSDTVHEHFVVPSEGYTRIGRYYHCSTANRAVVASAVAITTDTVGTYMYMSTLAATTARVAILREVSISYGSGDPVISKTAPVITASKYTFNVAHSGTTQNICQAQTSSTLPLANVAVSPAGATVTPVGDFGAAVIPAIFTTVGVFPSGKQMLYEDREPYNRGAGVEIKSGEGIAIHQTVNGTASDTRVYTVKLVWDEIDVS